MTNATAILNDEMTLEEKLAAIDQMMADAQAKVKDAQASGVTINPADDPMNALMCDSCQ